MSNNNTGRSLQKKVSLTLIVVMGALAIVSFVTLNYIVEPAFEALELNEARTDLIRVERAINNDLDNLNAITADWALWDDAYDYVSGVYPSFRDSNLDRPTLTNLGLSVLAIYDTNHKLLWGQVDYLDEVMGIEKLGILNSGTRTAEVLISHADPAGHISGLLKTEIGPLMISSFPVVRSDGSGPIAGTLIMGQLFDESRASQLRQRTEVSLSWEPIDPSLDDLKPFQVPLNAPLAGTVRQRTLDTDIVSAGVLVDLFGDPMLLIEVRSPRSISALGSSTVNSALLMLALAAVIVALATWFSLRRIIVVPLVGLADHIVSIRKSGDLTAKIGDARDDEIGALAREFDRLTDELHDARKLLLDQSFRAGKADTAAEVLHNIRNAMTPMINGIDRLTRNFNVTEKLKVRKAIEQLHDAQCPPDRAIKLLQYLESSFSHIEANNRDAVENLGVAARQARHVEAILADQEKHTHVSPVIEKLNLDELIEEAVLVIPHADEPSVRLELEQRLHDLCVRAHRVSLLQVLVNLMLNAYEAIERGQLPDGKIDVAVCEEIVDERPMVRLTIKDTGCGFDHELSERIFQRGFSSKDGNAGGLGLHWCANAVAGMGGRISAESKGPGMGAEFHVLLPAAPGG